jgi:ATP-dependent RNA helicase DDX31/DBP7
VHIVAGLLIGGESVKSEKEKIRKGINVVIGTPGKILYHMKNTRGL